jgi:dienelactone hydrolase
MRAIITTSLLFCFSLFSFAQYQIGQRTITFNDPDRTGGFGSGGGPGRQIQTEIYYPATTAGVNATMVNDSFPVIVFGHGFVMSWDAYKNIWEYFVPRGYIMCFPRTEGNFSPSHEEFGKDLRLVVEKMLLAGNDNTHFFYNKISSRSAIMGHSMGGGSTVLAAANNTSIKTIVCLAPAETNPSAVTQAANITVPSLVFSGEKDGVTPPAEHHLPIYNALSSDCKTFINIKGGAHCYFANSNFNCDFGEGSSSTGISINRTEQQNITQSFAKLWLDFYLKGNCSSWEAFLDSVQTSTRVIVQNDCQVLSKPDVNVNVTQPLCFGDNGKIILDITGSEPFDINYNGLDPNDIPTGQYSIEVKDANGCLAIENYFIQAPDDITINEDIVNPSPGQGGSIDLVVNGGTQPYTFEWNNSETTQNIDDLVSGTYTVIVTDANGCQKSETYTLIGTTSIEDKQVLKFQAFPNPFNEQISISFSGVLFTSMEVIDISGRTVYAVDVKGEEKVTIKSLGWDKGIYFIRAYDLHNKAFNMKLVKE